MSGAGPGRPGPGSRTAEAEWLIQIAQITSDCLVPTARPTPTTPASGRTPGRAVGRPRARGVHERTLGELSLTEGSVVFHLAGHLTHSWNEDLWKRVSRLVAAGVPEVPHNDRLRQVKPRQVQRRLSTAEMDDAVRDYAGGMSSIAVGKKYGIDPQTVLSNLSERGITPRPPFQPRIPDEAFDELLALRQQGWSWKQLGEKYGCSHSTARNAVLRAERSNGSVLSAD